MIDEEITYFLNSFRFGHSQVNSLIFRLDEQGEISKYGHTLLRETFFNPVHLEDVGGLEPILRGTIAFPAQEVSRHLVFYKKLEYPHSV